MASLYRVGPGVYKVSWCATPRSGPDTGRRIRGAKTFHNKTDAQQFYADKAKWEVAVRTGLPLGKDMILELQDDFLDDYKIRRAKSTYDRVAQCLPRMLGWLVRNDADMLAGITPEIVVRYQRHRDGDGAKANTINREVSALSSFLIWAVKTKRIAQHPLKGELEPVTADTTADTRLPNPAEIRKVLRLIRRQDRHVAWKIVLLYATGVRISELCDAQIDSVDLHHRVWHIMGKGRKKRDIQLSGNSMVAVRHLLEYAAATGSKYLAPTRSGRRMDRSTIGTALKALCLKAGAIHFSPHTLRHCFGTWHASGGTPLPDLQIMMGHESITTTIDNYFHSVRRDHAAVARSFRRGRA